jgi:hypothetical protein
MPAHGATISANAHRSLGHFPIVTFGGFLNITAK